MQPNPQTPPGAPVTSTAKHRVERRKHKRFHALNGAFVALGPYCLKLGQIVNMSLGGLAFRYIGSREPSRMKTESTIFVDNRFCLDYVPLETVSDYAAKPIRATSLVMRQTGVQFGELTRNQISRLEYFIHNHTACECV